MQTQQDITIPPSFKKFFWDADFSKLDLHQHENYILGKLMTYGDFPSVKWILHTFDAGTVGKYLDKRGEHVLDRKSFLFWKKLLQMEALWRRP